MAADIIQLPTAVRAALPKQPQRGKCPARVVPASKLTDLRGARSIEQALDLRKRAEAVKQSKDTVEVLHCLLAAAQMLRGLVIYFCDDEGHEDAIFTGVYRADPSEAYRAAMRMAWHLADSKPTPRDND